MIINQDIINNHMNADPIEKIFIIWMIDQSHENKNNSKFISNQSWKYITIIFINDKEYQNNQILYSFLMMNIKNGNQDQDHKR